MTAKVLHESPCPVWTGAHLEEAPAREFSIRHILCSVDLTSHSQHTVSLAAEMAAAVDATLTLVHIAGSVEFYGPGGSYVAPSWKEKIVGFAAKEITKLQQDAGTKAEVIIDSDNVPKLLSRAGEQRKADVLVIGHSPIRGHMGDNGNGYPKERRLAARGEVYSRHRVGPGRISSAGLVSAAIKQHHHLSG